MKTINSILLILTSVGLIACNSGGSSSGGGSTGVSPNPNPPSGQYATLPDGFASALPSFVQPQSSSLQIAWGYNTNPAALNLAARILMNGNELCSATPVAADSSGGTWLVGAAHCFVNSKAATSLVGSDLVVKSQIKVNRGFNGDVPMAESAIVYLPSNYCLGSAFDSLGKCPNFSPSEGASDGQGNDIALIHINTKFNESEVYPQINNGSGYPTAYTMAPVLSLGYGDNNVTGGNGKLFYVVNYFYQQSNAPGYHYLYNSYFNPSAGNYGYSALVCGGDSGGGDLYWNGTNWILLSEHTYGPYDGDNNTCGVYYNYLPNASTNVSKYYTWLTNIINSGSEANATAYCKTVSANCVTNG